MMSTVTLWALIIGALSPRLMDRFSEEWDQTVFFTDGGCVGLSSESSCNVYWALGGVHSLATHRDLLGQTGRDWTGIKCSLSPALNQDSPPDARYGRRLAALLAGVGTHPIGARSSAAATAPNHARRLGQHHDLPTSVITSGGEPWLKIECMLDDASQTDEYVYGL